MLILVVYDIIILFYVLICAFIPVLISCIFVLYIQLFYGDRAKFNKYVITLAFVILIFL